MTDASSSERVADELRQVLGALVRRMRVKSADQRFTWSQLFVLRRLDIEGPATTADLARAELITPQSMGTTVAELESCGFVVRTDDATDGRRRLISITPSGRKARAEGREARKNWLASAIEARLDPGEQRTVLAALALLRRIVEL